jgi:AcrR family transcriptional regulator
MSPRGVAIPELREQLFAAADRVLERDGPAGLTSRAITEEAGVAKGVLHNHFADLDGFLVAYAIDRIRAVAARAQQLEALAGQQTVTANLTEAAVTLFGPTALALSRLILARPSLLGRINEALASGSDQLGVVEAAIASYLDAEQKLGRVDTSVDTKTLALALVGSVHHLFFTRPGQPLEPAAVQRIVAALVGP